MFAVEAYGILHTNNQLNNARAVLFIQKSVMSIRGIVPVKG